VVKERRAMNGFRLGKWFGIDIEVDWSWVFIFVLMTWNLTSAFGTWHPDWPRPQSFGVAAVASVLFFVCILLHELAHSLVATRFGLRVRSITLFLFGGVSNIEREPRSAGAEFLIAVVGPLTSIALGGVFVMVAAAIASHSAAGAGDVEGVIARLGPATTLLAWLGPVNLGIGVFNLVPAFPLDGGRVLRAVIWGASGDVRFATLASSVVGQAIAWMFIVAGIAMVFGARLPVLGGGVTNGLWLAFVGWFLHGAAVQAYRRLLDDDAGIPRRNASNAAP
jgi:Zn-dependent protease